MTATAAKLTISMTTSENTQLSSTNAKKPTKTNASSQNVSRNKLTDKHLNSKYKSRTRIRDLRKRSAGRRTNIKLWNEKSSNIENKWSSTRLWTKLESECSLSKLFQPGLLLENKKKKSKFRRCRVLQENSKRKYGAKIMLIRGGWRANDTTIVKEVILWVDYSPRGLKLPKGGENVTQVRGTEMWAEKVTLAQNTSGPTFLRKK
jgi:hypothetical protein